MDCEDPVLKSEQLLIELTGLTGQVFELIRRDAQLEDLRGSIAGGQFPTEEGAVAESAAAISELSVFASVTESCRFAAFKAERLLQRQLGRCWLIRVVRGDSQIVDCFAEPDATLAELKRLVAMETAELVRQSGGPHRAINWRQVWRRFALALGTRKLLNDAATLTDIGLYNRCQLTFVPRLREKNAERQQRRQ